MLNRVVVGPLHHVLEGHEHGGWIFLLGRLAEVEAVALVAVGREVGLDGFQQLAGVVAFTEHGHQPPGGRGEHYLVERGCRLDLGGDREHVVVGCMIRDLKPDRNWPLVK